MANLSNFKKNSNFQLAWAPEHKIFKFIEQAQ